MIYVDTSAAVKALVDEPDSSAMRDLFAGDEPMISSRLFAVELHAVVDRRGADAGQAQSLIDRVALASLDDAVADRAVALHTGLRTLDALHLATALELGGIVTEFLSYDVELCGAARARGLRLRRP